MLVCIACEREEPARMQIPFSIYLPANTPIQRQGPRRVMGDPGEAETFALPNYVYVFVVWYKSGQWRIAERQELRLQDRDWEAVDYAGSLMSSGDPIYRVTRHLNILMSEYDMQGRVYAIASPVELSFDRDLSSLTLLDEVLDLKIDVSSEEVQKNLHNIYTTPYNYEIGGEYYCSFVNSVHHVVQLEVMLYHIASKVDIKWNVAEDKRIAANPADAIRLTYMQVKNLFAGEAYCFKPMRNVLNAKPTTGPTVDIVSPEDEGLWWEGRSYFYTIPYTIEGAPNYFPLQVVMRTNDSSGSGYQLTLNQPMDTTDVFVPWIRGVFNFNQPLETKTAVKTVD